MIKILTFLFLSLSVTAYSQIIPPVNANSTYNLTANQVISFYDPSGPGGNPCGDATVAAGNYSNCNCFTRIRINAAAGQFLIVNFNEFAMWNTTSGWDWMKIYDGPNTASPILFDNSSTGANNPMGDCGIGTNVLSFCSTGNSLTFEFWATSVVNRAGWDAVVTSVVTPCSPLPVELIAFTGENKGRFNELSWSTASESNNDYFLLENSQDGVNWNTIATENGAGNSTQLQNYGYQHGNFANKLNYYRLSQVDFDGTRKVYKIVPIDNTDSSRTLVKTVNLMGQEVGEHYHGLVIRVYSDGTTIKEMM